MKEMRKMSILRTGTFSCAVPNNIPDRAEIVGVLNMENGCCKDKPVLVARSRSPEHPPLYGCECSCGGWNTTACEHIDEAINHYRRMNEREPLYSFGHERREGAGYYLARADETFKVCPFCGGREQKVYHNRDWADKEYTTWRFAILCECGARIDGTVDVHDEDGEVEGRAIYEAAKCEWNKRARKNTEYHPDSDDDHGQRRYTEAGAIDRMSPPKDHVCSGHYHGRGSERHFIPDRNWSVMKKYRDWSKTLARHFRSKSRGWLPKGFEQTEPYLVFFDYKHDIFAIYYGIEGYCYSIHKTRIDSKGKLLEWVMHLSRKRWFSRKHLFDLFWVWEDVFGEIESEGDL